jgi:hypothetical protein
MTPRELALVEETISSVYQEWHLCALRHSERGIPRGTLCDGCNESIRSRMAVLRDKLREQSK